MRAGSVSVLALHDFHPLKNLQPDDVNGQGRLDVELVLNDLLADPSDAVRRALHELHRYDVNASVRVTRGPP